MKSLPGGGPQGTLLGLLLFLVLINDIGFEGQENNAGVLITSKRNMKVANEIHLKYVDDITLAEAIDLPTNVKYLAEDVRPQPDMYHARTGHVLPIRNSKVQNQLNKTLEYARRNEMVINYKKTKVMIFNPCTSIDVLPELSLENNELEVVDEIRLLGIIIRSDLKWIANTENMVIKANKRLWIIRRLKYLGAEQSDLVDIYTKQIRSVLELAVPVWNNGITLVEQLDIERIQKSAAHIILGAKYDSYKIALKSLGLDSLKSRRDKLCLKFTLKAEKNEKFQKWFKPAVYSNHTRQKKFKFCEAFTIHKRFKKSPLPYLTSILNEKYGHK